MDFENYVMGQEIDDKDEIEETKKTKKRKEPKSFEDRYVHGMGKSEDDDFIERNWGPTS